MGGKYQEAIQSGNREEVERIWPILDQIQELRNSMMREEIHRSNEFWVRGENLRTGKEKPSKLAREAGIDKIRSKGPMKELAAIRAQIKEREKE